MIGIGRNQIGWNHQHSGSDLGFAIRKLQNPASKTFIQISATTWDSRVSMGVSGVIGKIYLGKENAWNTYLTNVNR